MNSDNIILIPVYVLAKKSIIIIMDFFGFIHKIGHRTTPIKSTIITIASNLYWNDNKKSDAIIGRQIECLWVNFDVCL